jgi:hypothetical protein
MKWFLIIYFFKCASVAEADMSKCPSSVHKVMMPSKEICYKVKELNGTLAECWATEIQ